MTPAILLFLMLASGGVAMLAQWARKNRRAEVTLHVVLLAVAAMAALVGVLSGAGLLSSATGEAVEGFDAVLFVGSGLISIAGGLLVVGVSLTGVLRLQRRPVSPGGETRRRLDPPVFLALWLLALVVPSNLSGLLLFTASGGGGLAAAVPGASGLPPGEALLTQIPLLVLAPLGVGLFVNRSPREVVRRLGYGGLSARPLATALAAGIAAYVLSIGADRLFATLQPGLYERVGPLAENVVRAPEVGAVAGLLLALPLGAALALGEETLLRGAVQPAFGVLATAVLSASLPVGYGLSPILLFVLVLSVGLGLLRRVFNTTASLAAHAVFNALLVGGAYWVGG